MMQDIFTVIFLFCFGGALTTVAWCDHSPAGAGFYVLFFGACIVSVIRRRRASLNSATLTVRRSVELRFDDDY